MDKATGGSVVCFERSRGLQMSQGRECRLADDGSLAVVENAAGFALGGRLHNAMEGFADGQDGSVWFGIGLGRRGRGLIT